MQTPEYSQATILSGASLSGAIPCAHREIVGVEVVGDWTAAGVVLEASSDGTTYRRLVNPSGDVGWGSSVVPTSGGAVLVLATPLRGIAFAKIRSGTHATPANQGADRTVRLLFQPA